MKRIFVFVSIIILAASTAYAQNVVASTSWTEAFARLAGAETVTCIAPSEMTHPAEYEITPKDIERIKGADFFVCAGYEVMVKALTQNSVISETKVIRITTQNDWTTVSTQVRLIAVRLGTIAKAEQNLASLKSMYDEGLTLLSTPEYKDKKYLVHSFQVPIVKMLGLPIVGIFGPAPLSPKQISELSSTHADIIIDNIHNPVALPLSQLLKNARYVQFLNFPGMKGTVTLGDVFEYNIAHMK